MRSPTDAVARPRHERLVVAIGPLVAGAAAVLGTLVLVWVLLSVAFGFRLVAFATGSMAPEYPVGSLAVARAVDLDDIRPGDVVTVPRGHGLLPITHRVRSVSVQGDRATLTLKGDANRYSDPAPYEVRSVQRVVLPLAWLSTPIAVSTSPIGVGAGAALATAVAIWAIWPLRRDPGTA